MKILAINGSHRVGQNTDYLINEALSAAAELGAETEVVELSEKNIEYCTGCNRFLRMRTIMMTISSMKMMIWKRSSRRCLRRMASSWLRLTISRTCLAA